MKKTILIPENINGITLGQYQKYLSVSVGIEGEFLNQRAIETLCSVPFGDVVNMAHKDVRDITNKLSRILADETSFSPTFEVEGEKFGFIPDLEAMTSGEYADLSAYITKPEDMHLAMAVMFRPIIREYDGKYSILEYSGTQELGSLMKFMPLGAALGAMVFFWDLAKDLVSATQHFIKREVTKDQVQEQEDLLRNGDFIKISTHLQKEILQNSAKLQS